MREQVKSIEDECESLREKIQLLEADIKNKAEK